MYVPLKRGISGLTNGIDFVNLVSKGPTGLISEFEEKTTTPFQKFGSATGR